MDVRTLEIIVFNAPDHCDVVMLHVCTYMYTHACMHCMCTHVRSHVLFVDRCLHIRLFILEMSFHDLHYLSSLPHPFSSLSSNMHTAVHMHGDGYMMYV